MTYKIISEAEKIEAFRNEQEFTIFDSTEQVQTTHRVTIDDLEKVIVEHQPDKSKRKLIQFNPFIEGRKTQLTALLPHTCMVDIDFKGADLDERKKRLCEDLKENNFDTAFSKLVTILKTDPCCFYFDTSSSHGKTGDYGEKIYGCKALFNIVSSYWWENNGQYEPDGETSKTLMKENYKVLLSYLYDTYGIKARSDKNVSYIDNVGARLQQGVYTSWGKNIMVNPNAHIIAYNIDKVTNLYQDQPKLTFSQLRADNDNFSQSFLPKIKDLLNRSLSGETFATEQYNLIISDLARRVDHYDSALSVLFSLKHLDQKYLKHYYSMIKNLYQGGSIPLRNFEVFKAFIDKLQEKYAIPLSNLLRVTDLKRNTNNDLLQNTYDVSIEYTKFVSEKRAELYQYFDYNQKTYIKAEAGGGKTTLLVDYAVRKLKHGFKKVVLVIPKNSLLEQQYAIIKKRYPKLQVTENFDKKNYKDEEGLILSSTVKVNRIPDPDLIIIDEVQNLVNYSNEIISNIKHPCKKIMVSATAEKYLICEQNYTYINLHKTGEQKKNLTMFVSKQHNKLLKFLINPARKQLIFYNNLDESKKIFTRHEFGIDFTFVNSPNKDSIDSQNVILNQYLDKDHYVITSFLTDGINFNNTHWDDIIIVENGTVSADEIYQLSNRFRLLQNEVNTILIAKPRPLKYGGIDFNKLKDMAYYGSRVQELKMTEKMLNTMAYRNENHALMKSPYFIKNERTFTYSLNEDSIKLEMYREHFLDKYFTCQNVMAYALEYYFMVTMYFRVEKDPKGFSNNNKLNNLFMQNLSGITNVLRFIDHAEHMSAIPNVLPVAVLSEVENHFSYFKRLTMRVVEIEEVGGDVTKCTLPENNYKTYIKGINKKFLGKVTNVQTIDNYDKLYYDRQSVFMSIVRGSALVHQHNSRKGNFDYITDADVVSYFTANPNEYDNFKNERRGYDFQLKKKSVSVYLNSIGRYIEKKRIMSKTYYKFV